MNTGKGSSEYPLSFRQNKKEFFPILMTKFKDYQG